MTLHQRGRKLRRAVSVRVVSQLIGLAAFTTCTLSCQFPADVWIVPGSVLNDIVFGVSEDRKKDVEIVLDEFRVFRCDDVRQRYDRDGALMGSYPPSELAVWSIARSALDHGRLNRLRYGSLPEGMTQRTASRSLSVGDCLIADAWIIDSHEYPRHGVTGFTIEHDGTTRELKNSELDGIFSRSEP